MRGLLGVLSSRLGGRDNLPWVIRVLRRQVQVEALHFLRCQMGFLLPRPVGSYFRRLGA